MIISISGTDGSGKSSVCEGLDNRLQSKNIKVKGFVLGEYFILVYFLNFAKFLLKSKSSNSETTSNPFLTRRQQPAIYKLWVALVLVDNILNFLRLKIYSFLGYVVVCDRYFYDRLVGLDYFGYISPNFFSVYLALTPKPDKAILLDLNAELCLAREQKEKHSLDFYNDLRSIFKRLHSKFDLIIDANNLSQEDVVRQIFDVVYAVE